MSCEPGARRGLATCGSCEPTRVGARVGTGLRDHRRVPERPRGPLTPSGPPLGGDREIQYRKPRNWFQHHVAPIVTVLVVLVVVGGIVAAVLATRDNGDVAGDTAAMPLVSSSAAPSPTPTPSPSASAVTTTAAGTVAAVLAPGSWTLSVQKDLDLTVVTTATTTYSRDKSAGDIKVGTSITVVGTIAEGVITAQTVTIENKKKD